ncbi:hypothetical protein JR316_0004336 [Psilocybe cubensis]|uniref:Uncharacterized protein n=2 Tax=Psilocybe cubensis TaxID=181762 RepID=A0ACB8H2L8_PSICU|nr:hypothetical protein JR316_0004336 [Psilocybe cubensis]KAH9482238.1 hypothetical protein JR316_0004336 [Psilocybe cubensis]
MLFKALNPFHDLIPIGRMISQEDPLGLRGKVDLVASGVGMILRKLDVTGRKIAMAGTLVVTTEWCLMSPLTVVLNAVGNVTAARIGTKRRGSVVINDQDLQLIKPAVLPVIMSGKDDKHGAGAEAERDAPVVMDHYPAHSTLLFSSEPTTHHTLSRMAHTLEYQFDAVDADVILLCTEMDRSTEFHIHKCILSAASPFFDDMFTLPQLADDASDKVPIIPVSEPSHILDTLLRYVYPVSRPIIESLDELLLVLDAAVKYDFPTVITALRSLLLSSRFLQLSPIRVYAVACRYGFWEEAKIASRHTLSVNLLDAPPTKEFKYISAYEYHQLLTLHKTRASAAIDLIRAPEDFKCMQCNGSAFTMNDAPKWWHQFEKKAKAELAVRPTTEVIFGMEFLFKAAQSSGCSRCPESVLDSWKFLQHLKESIDALPSTVSGFNS